jgi:tetratricopeptide (TPR) repeat protein
MYTYKRKRFGPVSIFFIAVFILTAVGMGCLAYLNKGKFWDILPYVCIPVIILSIVIIIFNLIRRNRGNFFFTLFFLSSLLGLILSYIFGPSVLSDKAQNSFESEDYGQSIDYYNELLKNYPGSSLAVNALGNVPYSYYANADYQEAIISFEEAIDSGLISNSDLEVKNIFEDCYYNLAQENYNSENYSQAGENYLNAAEVLKEINKEFANTNEAFISLYKIPEYLYNAALSFIKTDDQKSSIAALEEIIENYNSSEYFNLSGALLFDLYIEQAAEMSDNFDYTDGIEEFLKVLDLEVRDKSYHDIPDSKKRKVFFNIPVDTLKDTASNKYSSGSYKKAAFLYELIIEYHPESEDELDPLLVDSKIKSIASSNHNIFTLSAPERKLWGREKSILIIENNTSSYLTVYLNGPEPIKIKADKNSSIETEITAGTYEVASEFTDNDILPCYGTVTFEEGQRYREEYTIPD